MTATAREPNAAASTRDLLPRCHRCDIGALDGNRMVLEQPRSVEDAIGDDHESPT